MAANGIGGWNPTRPFTLPRPPHDRAFFFNSRETCNLLNYVLSLQHEVSVSCNATSRLTKANDKHGEEGGDAFPRFFPFHLALLPFSRDETFGNCRRISTVSAAAEKEDSEMKRRNKTFFTRRIKLDRGRSARFCVLLKTGESTETGHKERSEELIEQVDASGSA